PLLRVLTCMAALVLPGCGRVLFKAPVADPPRVLPSTQAGQLLKSLPPAREKTVVSVYDFQDQTRQFKPNTQFAEYSKEVTQGGLSILNKALMEAGDGTWFTVIERGGLRDLLQERQITNLMREQYLLPDGKKLEPLPPMLYAGMLIEGGVVG